jgi:mono/diheme cytochrome c family protein
MQNSCQQLWYQLLQAVPTFAIVGVAQAAPAISDGSRLYAPCVVCHQPNASGSPDGAIPNLAGQQDRYLGLGNAKTLCSRFQAQLFRADLCDTVRADAL